MSRWRIILYLAFAAGISWACFVRPADNLDRYIYEALVRGRYQSVETAYAMVKHESPRAEASSSLDSPLLLGQLEPLYAIKPIYVGAISLLSAAGMPIQHSISLVSAVSLFGIAILLLVWTRSPLYSALLMASPDVLNLGRLGTPDALSTLFVVAAFCALARNSVFPGVLLLILSVWVRTDNLLITLCALAWLIWEGRVTRVQGFVLAGLALGSVLFINHFSGNYGWAVLFRYSFVAGRYPAGMPSHVSVREYVRAFATNFPSAAARLGMGVLLGLIAWRFQPRYRHLLFVVAIAAASHFLLFPSPEPRLLVWTYLIAGSAFITSIGDRIPQPGGSVTAHA